jgi:hypothetical protein
MLDAGFWMLDPSPSPRFTLFSVSVIQNPKLKKRRPATGRHG